MVRESCTKQSQGTPDVAAQEKRQADSYYAPYFALRSCSKQFNHVCDDIRTSICFHEVQRKHMAPYLQNLAHLKAATIMTGGNELRAAHLCECLTSLHSIQPSLESLCLCFSGPDCCKNVLVSPKAVLWSETLSYLKLQQFAAHDTGIDDGYSWELNSLAFINQLTQLRELVLIRCDPDLRSEDITGCTRLVRLTLEGDEANKGYSHVYLDVSSRTLLEELTCTNYNLQKLIVTGLTALLKLGCTSNNSLTVLDVSTCTALTHLLCNNNSLAALDLRHNSKLQCLDCSLNPLGKLQISSCSVLTKLVVNSCNLTQLDVSCCTALHTLECKGLKTSSLDLKACSKLQFLHADRCTDLHILDLAGMDDLKVVTLTHGSLTSLDVSHCHKLESLDCQSSAALTSLLVFGCGNLQRLCVKKCGQLSVDLMGCTSLSTLQCN